MDALNKIGFRQGYIGTLKQMQKKAAWNARDTAMALASGLGTAGGAYAGYHGDITGNKLVDSVLGGALGGGVGYAASSPGGWYDELFPSAAASKPSPKEVPKEAPKVEAQDAPLSEGNTKSTMEQDAATRQENAVIKLKMEQDAPTRLENAFNKTEAPAKVDLMTQYKNAPEGSKQKKDLLAKLYAQSHPNAYKEPPKNDYLSLKNNPNFIEALEIAKEEYGIHDFWRRLGIYNPIR